MPKTEDIKVISPLPVVFYDTRDAEKYGVVGAIIKQFLEQRLNAICLLADEPYLYLSDVLARTLGLTQDEVNEAVDKLAKHGVVNIVPGEHDELYLEIQGTVQLKEVDL